MTASNDSVEAARLAALSAYAILDTGPSIEFDRLTVLATRLFDVPTAMVTLVDEHRQWFKSRVGLLPAETPRAIAFCDLTVRRRALTIVSDTEADPRFASNPLVTGDPHVRFYAGAPLIVANGHAIGTIAIIDYVSRDLSLTDGEMLELLAGLAVDEIELFRYTRLLSERHDVERRKSERRFAVLFENTVDLILLLDDRGSILFASPSVQRVLGHPAADFARKNVFMEIHPDDIADARRVFDELVRSTRGSAELRFRMRDRSRAWLRMSAVAQNLLAEPDLRAVVLTCRDITEHERAIAELEKSERYYRALTEGSSELVLLVDATGTIRFASGAVETVLGYEAANLVGSSLYRFVHQDDVERANNDQRELLSRPGQVARVEYRMLASDGSFRCIDVAMKNHLYDAVIHAVVMNLRDVTARRDAEEQARQRVRQQAVVAELGALARQADGELRTLFEAAVDAVARALDAEYVAVYELAGDGAQLKVQAGHGWPSELVGRTVEIEQNSIHRYALLSDDPVMVDDYESERRFRAPSLLAGHGIRSAITVTIGGARKPFGLLCVGTRCVRRFGEEDGNFVQAVANLLGTAIRDALALLELQRHEEQLRRAQKMEAVGQLAGGIAHDFNNALTAILSYAELALGTLPEASRARADIAEIRAAGQRAASLTRQILAFSRQQVLNPVELDLDELIRGLLNLLTRTLGEHVELTFVPSPRRAIVRVDAHQLEQAIINVCVNARDAMPNGGLITVETRVVAFSDCDLAPYTWSKPGRYVQVSITDTGCGMDQAVLEHVFEPFFTTKEVGKGTGLGLSTVYGVVKQHGGFVTVDSVPGRGATFTLHLPMVDQQPSSSPPEPQPVAAARAETLLLAEDDDLVRGVALRILGEAGYDVIVATNGEQAVQLFREHRKSIALVILDVVMPRLGGRAALEQIRAAQPDVKFLLCSGYARETEPVALTADEQAHWLSKPYNAATLLKRVRLEIDGASATADPGVVNR